MKKKALHKNFLMEIKNSLNRFLSIFFIVALGVAFYSGIQSTAPDMRYLGDAYYDENGLMDLKVAGSMGITQKDIEALESLEYVEKVEAGYMTDVICGSYEDQAVLHMESLLPTMNKVNITEGRMPEQAGECILDERFASSGGYHAGDTLEIKEDINGDEEGILKSHEYVITGLCSSSEYISFGRGSTTIGTGEISGFIYVLEDNFDLEVYTQVCLAASGAKDTTAYTDEYDAIIDRVTEQVEDIKGLQCKARYREIKAEADEKLTDAKKELEDGKQEADEKLSDAKAELDDAQKQLDEGKEELADAKKQIEDARSELSSKQAELDSAKAQIADGQTKLDAGRKELASSESEFNKTARTAQKKIDDGEKALKSGKKELEAGKKEYESSLKAFNSGKEQYEQLKAQYESALSVPDSMTEEQLLAMKQQLDGLKSQLDTSEKQLAAAKKQLDDSEKTIKSKETELNKAKEELAKGKKELEAAKEELAKQEANLQSARNQTADGESQIASGWAKLADSEQEIQDGEAEISENEEKLADGKKEYEDAKKEAEETIADGEAKIADAEKEIADLKVPKWYISDRTDLPEYSGYGDNADRIRNLGRVFPVLFFLVAALVSLTTMTRMVEEERTQIGTLKALGYGKLSIASKYINYALLATVGGSILGMLIGEKLLPYIIIRAYGVLYPNIPIPVIPFNLEPALFAAGGALICTIGATMLSCYKELAAASAVLMRPPAPKKGKRVFLERFTFLWNHLSFTWKATIRNLFRYKKRFFMTIFGIGGCMALLLVGYGLRDSIQDIGKIQYGEIHLYDGMIVLDEDASSADKEELDNTLAEESDIQSAMTIFMKKINIKSGGANREVYLVVPKEQEVIGGFINIRDRLTGEEYVPDDEGIILTEKTAKLLEVEQGDKVSIVTDGGTQMEVKVSNICENYMMHYAYMTPGLYEQLYKTLPEYNNVYFTMKDGAESMAEQVGEKALTRDAALSVTYTKNMVNQLQDMLSTLDSVIIVLIISAGMLAFVVLYNLNNININERKRELATIKVLGFYDMEVGAYVYRENILLTVIGTAFGVILGIILHRFVVVTVEVDLCMFGRNINFLSFVYAILFTFGFSVIVNFTMFFKLRKIDMVESLKSVE